MTLLDSFEKSAGVRRALDEAEAALSSSVGNAHGVALLLFSIASAARAGGPVLTILPDYDSLSLFDSELAWLLENENLSDRWDVLRLPDYDIADLDAPSAIVETRRRRLWALDALYNGGGHTPWVLATMRGAARKTMSARMFRDMTLFLREGEKKPMKVFMDALVKNGYERKKIVRSPGDFCVRGGMIDVFPAHAEEPFRMEMAGDTIEEIRAFNTETQRSSGRLEEVRVCACSEAAVHSVRGSMDDLREDHRLLVERGIYFDGAVLYPETFGADANPLLDGLFTAIMTVDPEKTAQEYKLREENALKWLEWNEFGDPAGLYEKIYTDISGDIPQSQKTSLHVYTADKSAVQLPVDRLPPLPMKLSAIADKIRSKAARGQVLIISKYKKRLDRFLEDEGITSVTTREGDVRGGVCVTDLPLFIFTDSDMFHRPPSARRDRPRKKRKDRMPVRAPEDLSEGDFVVHVDHGVGVYEGIGRQSSGDGYQRDFFRIKYARGDILFVPIEQVDRIEKYIGAEASLPKVYPLHSKRWENVKKKVRKKVEDMAGVLFRLYQDRKHVTGHAFSGDNVFIQELEESFPYEETDDQAASIDDVIKDMQRGAPMDRLVYGDVGFGKTEVAIRAAFKATLDKKQVAVLAPTTILAHQHGETFRERLARFPVSVDVLSRFKNRTEQKDILKRLEAGELDIVIGTHRLLSKDVKFKDLGLLVVDEEQRFGVKHKETMKLLKANIDVLTLTATPIPRTLNMSMIGLRDMSMISTPPEDRRAVKTFVEEFNTNSIYVALHRELARDGQVYYVHNRIETIDAPRTFIENAFPDARVAVTHGKMPEREIERNMVDFYNGEYDILVSTTIIENGLDIPNVNTIIVVEAENFGLGQMYQLRGRVGRSYRQSYAYFFHSPIDTVNDKGRARLSAIHELADLGSGYRLAMKDLEIRGAGNLLGREQHGYVRDIGFHLYCRMLEESVRKISGVDTEEPLPPAEVDFTVDSFIPDDYIDDTMQRTLFYRRVMACSDADELDITASEIVDRYGPLPLPAKRFFLQARIRLTAALLGIVKIKTHPKIEYTEIMFHTPQHKVRFQEGPYPIALTLNVEHMPDTTRVEHPGATLDRAMEEILIYLKFVAEQTVAGVD
ncbi:transcription-repair coupling factor [bacterium]